MGTELTASDYGISKPAAPAGITACDATSDFNAASAGDSTTPVPQNAIGVVTLTKGSVTVIRHGESNSTTVQCGDFIMKGDTVNTGSGGLVGIDSLTNDGTFALGPDKSVDANTIANEINENDKKAAEFAQKLEDGKTTLSNAGDQIPPSREEAMRVLTPTTVLGVRG